VPTGEKAKQQPPSGRRTRERVANRKEHTWNAMEKGDSLRRADEQAWRELGSFGREGGTVKERKTHGKRRQVDISQTR